MRTGRRRTGLDIRHGWGDSNASWMKCLQINIVTTILLIQASNIVVGDETATSWNTINKNICNNEISVKILGTGASIIIGHWWGLIIEVRTSAYLSFDSSTWLPIRKSRLPTLAAKCETGERHAPSMSHVSAWRLREFLPLRWAWYAWGAPSAAGVKSGA